MRRLRLLLGFALLAGCGGDTSISTDLPATSTNVSGTFTLIAANGQAPPYSAFVTDTEQWWLLNDKVTIGTDNTWSETTNYQVFARSDGKSTNQQTNVAGTYAITNGQIAFTMVTGGSTNFTGSVTDNVLTLVYSGKRFLYAR